MADNPVQSKLNTHVKSCKQCREAKHIGETCQTGRILARLVESISTR